MDKIEKADSLRNKLSPTIEDWRECVKLLEEAAEDTALHSCENASKLANCYKDAAIILLKHHEKTPEVFAKALRLFKCLENVTGLPNWFEVYDAQLVARIAPAAYGFDPSLVEAGDDALIDALAKRLIDHKGPVETVHSLPKFFDECILQPALVSRGALTENVVAVRVLDMMINTYASQGYAFSDEILYTTRGQLYQYCKPKTEESFKEAMRSYQCAIKSKWPDRFLKNGAGASYTCLIDLLERPAEHGFEFVCGDEMLQGLQELKEGRDEWYKSDPTRRLMYFEMMMLTNHHSHFRLFPLLSPNETMARRALTLGSAALAESDNSFIKQSVAIVLALTYHHSFQHSEATLREALKYYRLAIATDTRKDNSLDIDFTYVNVSMDDRRLAHGQFTAETVKKALVNVLPVYFFPENHPDFQLLAAELEEFKEYVASFCDSNEQPPISHSYISKHFPEYRESVRRVREVMASTPNSDLVQKDAFVLSVAERVGTAALSGEGSNGGNAGWNEAEQVFADTASAVSTFYSNKVMAQFYIGFARTFSEVHTASQAIASGLLVIDTSHPAVSAISFLLSMAPLVGGVLPTLFGTAYESYMKLQHKSCALKMTRCFPMKQQLDNCLVHVLRRVQQECIAELESLDECAELVVEGLAERLYNKLSGARDFLKQLLAKGYPTETPTEKLASQLANHIIQQMIYDGAPLCYLSPDTVQEQLAVVAIKSITVLNNEKQDLIAHVAKAKSAKPVRNEVAPTTIDSLNTAGDDEQGPKEPLGGKEVDQKPRIHAEVCWSCWSCSCSCSCSCIVS